MNADELHSAVLRRIEAERNRALAARDTWPTSLAVAMVSQVSGRFMERWTPDRVLALMESELATAKAHAPVRGIIFFRPEPGGRPAFLCQSCSADGPLVEAPCSEYIALTERLGVER